MQTCDVRNYHSVSLTSICSKPLEHIINTCILSQRITSYVKRNTGKSYETQLTMTLLIV